MKTLQADIMLQLGQMPIQKMKGENSFWRKIGAGSGPEICPARRLAAQYPHSETHTK